MKRTLRRLALLGMAMLVGFAACEKDNDNTGIINGYEWVDLGLPSGLKWATCNVGATSPEEYGNYYAWGETTTKTEYTYNNSTTNTVDLPDISGNPTYDAACANWESTWRMPTHAEMQELRDECTWTWTTQNGVDGFKVRGKNGMSIFLPAAGEYHGAMHYTTSSAYWSSTPENENYTQTYTGAYCLAFYNGGYSCGASGVHSRDYGQTIRPVSD